MGETEIAEVIRRAEPSPVDGRAVDPDELMLSLADIRAKGYAITRQQRTPGGVGIAVPFFNAADEVVGNVGVTVPAFRFEPRSEAPLVAALARMAEEVSRALGSTRAHAVKVAKLRQEA